MTWMQTTTGLTMDLAAPRPEAVALRDVAAALSRICRFTGHTDRFYSVAEHSVRVAELLRDEGLPQAAQLLGLLHDAAEAYLGDWSAPLKHLADNEGWGIALRDLEAEVHGAVVTALAPTAVQMIDEDVELDERWGDAIRLADLRMLAAERRALMADKTTPWPVIQHIDPAPCDLRRTWDPVTAEAMFIETYRKLLPVGGR